MIRNKPIIRFNEYTSAWEQRKLGDVAQYFNGGSFENDVQENSEYTISQIPQGKYKLLIAYGKNWMTLQKDGETYGKFADNVHYEQSIDVFDFGKKNSKDMVNYLLTINVQENIHATNFNTEEIREDQFYSIK